MDGSLQSPKGSSEKSMHHRSSCCQSKRWAGDVELDDVRSFAAASKDDWRLMTRGRRRRRRRRKEEACGRECKAGDG